MKIKRNLASFAALSGLLLSLSVCQMAQAQTGAGTSLLAPIVTPPGGYSGSPGEYLTVNWSVALSGSEYLYTYTVNNPSTDVQTTPTGALLPGHPENFDYFSVDFDTTVPGAYLGGSQMGGTGSQLVDIGDLTWSFSPAIVPGGSATVSFKSDFGYVLGNGDASDSLFPSPWTTTAALGGQQLPVPDTTTVPEPTELAMLTLTFMGLVLARVTERKYTRQGK